MAAQLFLIRTNMKSEVPECSYQVPKLELLRPSRKLLVLVLRHQFNHHVISLVQMCDLLINL
jgi:hypothetical protein